MDRLQFNKTPSLNHQYTDGEFSCAIEHPEDLKVNEEVDNFKWFTFDEARDQYQEEFTGREIFASLSGSS